MMVGGRASQAKETEIYVPIDGNVIVLEDTLSDINIASTTKSHG
jgi:hypothetical protein